MRSAKWGSQAYSNLETPAFLEASPYRARASRPLPKGEGSVVNYLCSNFASTAASLSRTSNAISRVAARIVHSPAEVVHAFLETVDTIIETLLQRIDAI